MVFQELPSGNDVPRMVLRYPSSGKTGELDINAYSKELLDITVEQIGPQNCLSLLTIAGTLNPINTRALVEELDKLVARKVARAVVRFSDTATPLSSQIYSWLNQSVSNNRSSSQQQFPTIPASIRELHFSQIPVANSKSFYAGSGASQLRIHTSDSQAVSSALRTAYEVLGRDELVKSIENGHDLSRAAALANGAGRLASEKLPLILKYADDKNPLFQQGALVALKHFGEQAAIDKLLFYVKKNKAPLSQISVESLAGSRYPTAHDSLLNILQNEDPASRKSIVQVLARYPRPVWGKTLYEFAQGTNTELSTEALRALVQIGHPKLVEVLEEKLNTGNSTLRTEALRMLIKRDDPKSELLAMNYTLKFIEKNTPISEMFSLLNRTKDQRAIPLLLKHFEAGGNDRSTIISTLSQIGDASLEAPFVEKYPKLSNQEKRTVLTALQQLRSPHCRKLAGEALLTQDSSLASTASEILRKDGGPEAVQLLITAFEKTNHSSTLSYISNSLGQIGGNEIRPIMSKAKHSANSTKRTYARSALQRLLTRSPGYQFYAQAQNFAKQKKWTETISHYSLAIEVDPELPEAYAGRGNAYLQE
jgi:HEAT repeat protein